MCQNLRFFLTIFVNIFFLSEFDKIFSFWFDKCFQFIDKSTSIEWLKKDGSQVLEGDKICRVTGQSLSSSIGSSSLVQTTTEVVSGQSAALSLGTITQLPAVLVGVSGQSLTTAIGNEGQVTDVAVTLTGQSLTSSVGTPNITPWVEVDLGVTNNWTTVDLAA